MYATLAAKIFFNLRNRSLRTTKNSHVLEVSRSRKIKRRMTTKHVRVRRNTNNLTSIVVRFNSYAKVVEGREKVTAKGDVTRMAASGSRTSETEAELLSVDVDWGLRSSMQSGTLSARSFSRESKDQSGKPCITTRDLHQAVKARSLEKTKKKANVLWAMKRSQ